MTISFSLSVMSKSLGSSSRYSSGSVISLVLFLKHDAMIVRLFGSDIIEVCPINENLFKNCLKLFSFARTKEREFYPIMFLTSSIESASVPPDTGVASLMFK